MSATRNFQWNMTWSYTEHSKGDLQNSSASLEVKGLQLQFPVVKQGNFLWRVHRLRNLSGPSSLWKESRLSEFSNFYDMILKGRGRWGLGPPSVAGQLCSWHPLASFNLPIILYFISQYSCKKCPPTTNLYSLWLRTCLWCSTCPKIPSR